MIQNKKAGVRQLIIDAGQARRRIDNFIIKELGKVPKTRIYQMLRRGEIRVNGGRVKQGYRLQPGDRVRIPPVYTREPCKPAEPPPNLINIVKDNVIFEDRDLLVLNKPAGLVVHGGSGRLYGVIEILRYLRPAEPDLQLAHRLDRDTSGCLMVAKNFESLRWLHECLKTGRIEKNYTALLRGHLNQEIVDVSFPIKKNLTQSGERMTRVTEHGKHARTRFICRQRLGSATLACVVIYTGRTHQIRVHAEHIQHPIAGDGKYGDRAFNRTLRRVGLKRLFLHAARLHIPRAPGRTHDWTVEAPLPDDLEAVLFSLERKELSH